MELPAANDAHLLLLHADCFIVWDAERATMLPSERTRARRWPRAIPSAPSSRGRDSRVRLLWRSELAMILWADGSGYLPGANEGKHPLIRASRGGKDNRGGSGRRAPTGSVQIDSASRRACSRGGRLGWLGRRTTLRWLRRAGDSVPGRCRGRRVEVVVRVFPHRMLRHLGTRTAINFRGGAWSATSLMSRTMVGCRSRPSSPQSYSRKLLDDRFLILRGDTDSTRWPDLPGAETSAEWWRPGPAEGNRSREPLRSRPAVRAPRLGMAGVSAL